MTGFEAGEPKAMFALRGTSSFNGATYWAPIGNGERFVVPRSTPATGRDNGINVLINWQAGFELDQLVRRREPSLCRRASLPPISSTCLPSGAVEIIVTQQPNTPLPPFSAPGLTLGGAQTWNYVWDFRGLKH